MSSLDHSTLAPSDIIGPYCVWPQKRRKAPPRRLALVTGGTVAGVSVFLHCIAPLLNAA